MRNANRGGLWFRLCPWRICPRSQTQEKSKKFVRRSKLPQEKKNRQWDGNQWIQVKEKSDLKTPCEIKYTDHRLSTGYRVTTGTSEPNPLLKYFGAQCNVWLEIIFPNIPCSRRFRQPEFAFRIGGGRGPRGSAIRQGGSIGFRRRQRRGGGTRETQGPFF